MFELHIGTQTLIYQTVRVAEVCAKKGKIKTLGLDNKLNLNELVNDFLI